MLKKLLVDNNHILKNFKGKLSFDNHKIINGNLIGNFSSNEKMKLSPNFINFKKVYEENLNNKILKKITSKKGVFEIVFKPNEWKVIRIE